MSGRVEGGRRGRASNAAVLGAKLLGWPEHALTIAYSRRADGFSDSGAGGIEPTT
jgi:hypothetical protein